MNRSVAFGAEAFLAVVTLEFCHLQVLGLDVTGQGGRSGKGFGADFTVRAYSINRAHVHELVSGQDHVGRLQAIRSLSHNSL